MVRPGTSQRMLLLGAASFAFGALASFASVPRALAVAAMAVGFVLVAAQALRWRAAETARTSTQALTGERLAEWLHSAPMCHLAWDADFRIRAWNAEAERLFGMAADHVRDAPAPDFAMPLCTAVSHRLAAAGMAQSVEVSLQNEREEYLQLVVSAVRLPQAPSHLDVALVFNRTPARSSDSQRLDAAGMQRNALIREVHHRIKNHLQGVAGLLRQHLAGKPLLKPLLDAATSQVLSIAAVHGLQGEADSRLDLHSLSSRIAASISSIMHAPIVLEESCRVLQGVHLADEEAVPMAMVLNELFINAVKHRSLGPQGGLLRVSAARDAGGVRIVIANPGFLPPRFNFSLGAHVGTGLALVKSLLPARGAVLEIEERAAQVEARLVLHAPYVTLDGVPGNP